MDTGNSEHLNRFTKYLRWTILSIINCRFQNYVCKCCFYEKWYLLEIIRNKNCNQDVFIAEPLGRDY